jgi:hypothetical protein
MLQNDSNPRRRIMTRALLSIFLLADVAFLAWYCLSSGDMPPVEIPVVKSDGLSVGRMISSLGVPILIVAIVLYMVPDDEPSASASKGSEDSISAD